MVAQGIQKARPPGPQASTLAKIGMPRRRRGTLVNMASKSQCFFVVGKAVSHLLLLSPLHEQTLAASALEACRRSRLHAEPDGR